MLRKTVCFLCCCGLSLPIMSCSMENAEKSPEQDTLSESDTDMNLKTAEVLLENPENTAGNGYVIINDESDYPSYINKSYDKTVCDGYCGQFKENYSYGNFTGKYISYSYDNGNEDPAFSTTCGYADANGNHTDIPNAVKTGDFSNGYALVETYIGYRPNENGEYEHCAYDYFFIDENLNRVTSFEDESFTDLTASSIVNYDSDNMEYILPGGYFLYGSEDNYVVAKIAPELYDNLPR